MKQKKIPVLLTKEQHEVLMEFLEEEVQKKHSNPWGPCDKCGKATSHPSRESVSRAEEDPKGYGKKFCRCK